MEQPVEHFPVTGAPEPKTAFSTRMLVQLALFVAIILLMKITGLSSIHIGPLNMTLTMIPIAIGAMLLGPVPGALLGAFYGITSLYDAISGGSVLTHAFFQISPFHTVILCVVLRACVGYLTGVLFLLFFRADRRRTACFFLGGLAAPLLNTLLFMGYIVLVFYRTDTVQGYVERLGASGPFTFVVLFVGVQGLVEAATGCVIGGSVAKGVAHALKRDR